MRGNGSCHGNISQPLKLHIGSPGLVIVLYCIITVVKAHLLSSQLLKSFFEIRKNKCGNTSITGPYEKLISW